MITSRRRRRCCLLHPRCGALVQPTSRHMPPHRHTTLHPNSRPAQTHTSWLLMSENILHIDARPLPRASSSSRPIPAPNTRIHTLAPLACFFICTTTTTNLHASARPSIYLSGPRATRRTGPSFILIRILPTRAGGQVHMAARPPRTLYPPIYVPFSRLCLVCRPLALLCIPYVALQFSFL